MIKNRQELSELRNIYENSIKKQTKKILICAGTGCVAGGSLQIYDRLLSLMKENNINCSVELEKEPHDDSVGIKKKRLSWLL